MKLNCNIDKEASGKEYMHTESPVFWNMTPYLLVCKRQHVKLNPELPWQKQHSTRRKIFSPANWNKI
jgi:hypothetical protein